MSNSSFNIRWSEVIIESLIRHQMKYICIAPGSRSTPLTVAATSNKKLCCYTHFDERGLGYFALGISKASCKPVGVIVTSGTAVANLYPSLIEAGLTGEKIIFLTADRPPELIDCGSSQSIRQTYIFASHPSQQLMLPRPTRDISAKWLVSAIDNCMNNLHHGAFHINCPFIEPLYGEIEGNYDWQQSLGNWWNSDVSWLTEIFVNNEFFANDWCIWNKKKGVVIVGRVTANDGKEITHWAQALGWPIIGDVLSQTGQPYPCANLWLEHPQAKKILKQVEIVIQFGSSLTGKQLINWQLSCNPKEYWIIDKIPQRLDPANHLGRKFTCFIKNWLDNHKPFYSNLWCEELLNIAQKTKFYIHNKLKNKLSEASIAYQLPELLPLNGQLFIGNSLIIRLIDAFAQLPIAYPVYSNSGAKGIDGLISTIAGIQVATNKPTLGIIGDLSALYDINSLILLRKPSAPIVLIIINNNGGQIFSTLSIVNKLKQDYYCMPQNVNFRHAAEMFGLEYFISNNWLDLKIKVQQFWCNQNKSLLLELVVNGDEGACTLKELVKEVIKL
ncbi:2-succinyl-5-enolpyruvyl-6-hydroxy-3-cyclohexene-1-carboxylatesynthase [Candidatus Providencia siddallii]|uniref:2-succinyl-5-enolpyruvyl-6-hydroxy-3-cyclohexene-1-carboxylate synthase n=1 Tax=Candidatus Providencia siddallii TaxID=1715285 RepID=A0A0M6W7M1_9GAMM|nr:2-succinyl-5-enolpyruvyl-6-hydroxy-3-cyclohexene-1-carboxylatesynthase [Candidatus Providencia siddallii]